GAQGHLGPCTRQGGHEGEDPAPRVRESPLLQSETPTPDDESGTC
ncbi:hypothetical protein LCGC14_2598780, partial [marine sediment metagenome]